MSEAVIISIAPTSVYMPVVIKSNFPTRKCFFISVIIQRSTGTGELFDGHQFQTLLDVLPKHLLPNSTH